jgi:hypothetical protein
MTYEELKEMGFSHEAILARGIYPSGPQYSVENCADVWKIVKCRSDNKVKLTIDEETQFKDMMRHYTNLTGRELPRIKYESM